MSRVALAIGDRESPTTAHERKGKSMSTDLENEQDGPSGSKLRITQVTFGTLVSIGNYENERFSATAEVQAGQDPSEVMGELIDWVSRQACKPTRAEKAAGKLLKDIAGLHDRLNHYISCAHYRNRSAIRTSKELAEAEKDPAAASPQTQSQIARMRADLAANQQSLTEAAATCAALTAEIEAAERRPDVVAARALLQIAPGKPPVLDLSLTNVDDIPY